LNTPPIWRGGRGRQIAEAHGGTLTLQSREGEQGTRATVRLPV